MDRDAGTLPRHGAPLPRAELHARHRGGAHDRRRRELRPRQRDRVPAARTPTDGEIKPELMESVLEISTNPAPNTARGRRAAARACARRCATRPQRARPDHRLGGHAPVRDVGGPAHRRPRRATASWSTALRFVARQELIFGMHVHVGVDDPDKAIHVANGMRVHLRGAAGAERQLALLARRRDRAALDPHADLPHLPARRHPAALPRLGRLRERDRLHGRVRA